MKIQEKVLLSNYSTFKIGGEAEFFVIVKSENELLEAIKWAKENNKKIFILGSGSNSLFSDTGFSGLVIKNEIRGIEIISENSKNVVIRSFSGEIWSSLVHYAVLRDLYGIENTFYIPGTVGAAPMQNIGAYGTELKDVFLQLEAIDLSNGKKRVFSASDCRLAYRDSVFKRELKNKYFILSIDIVLNKEKKLNLAYPDIQRFLQEKNITEPNLKEITEIIREIRDAKLPNPGILPSAGSFFKNPIISQEHFSKLKEKFPDIKSYPDEKGLKIPAAWLIDKCGFKERDFGPVGVYEKQALIIVNFGGAKQSDVLALAKQIKQEVWETYDIELEEEVNIL